MVVSVLRKLDQVPLQVLIEATIAEVTLNETLRYGVQWFFRQGDSSVTLTTATSGAVAPAFPGFSYFLDGGSVKAVLDALETVTDLNIISSPQVAGIVVNYLPKISGILWLVEFPFLDKLIQKR